MLIKINCTQYVGKTIDILKLGTLTDIPKDLKMYVGSCNVSTVINRRQLITTRQNTVLRSGILNNNLGLL